MMGCLMCGSSVAPFLSFGRMPLANGFLTRAKLASEYFCELKAGFCESCTLVQLVDRAPRERMFHDHYPFFTATSERMAEHFKALAESVRRSRLPSLVAPLIYVRLRHSPVGGYQYPVLFPTLVSNAGMFGLYWVLLAQGLIALERLEFGAFLLATILLLGSFTLYDECFPEGSPLLVKGMMIHRLLNVVSVALPLMIAGVAARSTTLYVIPTARR